MIRTQIQLTEAQAQTLKGLAAETGESMAELIRQSIDMFIQLRHSQPNPKDKWQKSYLAIGKFHSGLSDLSVNHDHYLDEAYDYMHQDTTGSDQ